MNGHGGITEYAGGCEDWLNQINRPKEKAKRAPKPKEKAETVAPKKRKLLNKEREALKELPKQIEKMEADRDQITVSMQEPDYYRKPENDPIGDQQRLEELENKILEAMRSGKNLLNCQNLNLKEVENILIQASQKLSAEVSKLSFGEPTAYVYNPLDYAWSIHEQYLKLAGAGKKEVVFMGMNPCPFGMAQTGCPLGDSGRSRLDGDRRRSE